VTLITRLRGVICWRVFSGKKVSRGAFPAEAPLTKKIAAARKTAPKAIIGKVHLFSIVPESVTE
jgi:hypothetical protein